MSYKIYLSPPSHTDLEIKAVTNAIESGWLSTQGPAQETFSENLKNYYNSPLLLTNSGTSALHLALILANVQENDVVLCSNFSFVASAFPILYQKARPVFIGSQAQDWNLSLTHLKQAVQQLDTPPKALILTHVYGFPAEVDPILSFCQENDILFIEDAAEAMGATYKNQKMGTFGHFGAISFNGNKIITTSAGGLLLAKNENEIEEAKKIASQAKEKTDYYEHNVLGYNMLQSNILSAIGNAQMQTLSEKINKRRAIFDYYIEELSTFISIDFQKENAHQFSNRWLSSFVFPAGYAQKFKAKLAENLIESRYLFNPLNEQKVFKKALYFGDYFEHHCFKNGLSLPSGFELEREQQDEIINILKNNL